MGRYTDFLRDKSYDIFPDDENYIEELRKMTEMFRSFDEALDAFMTEHGYIGDLTDIDEKINFLSQRFKRLNIKIPRNMRKWFTEHKRIERKTAFQICFAFELGVEETDDFFRRICLQRGFDCHSAQEVIYFYALGHQLSYEEAERLISQIPKKKPGKIDFEKEVIYTSSILDAIEEFDEAKELVDFIKEHIEQFGYNNVAACRYIDKIWKEIASKDGLAEKEKDFLYREYEVSDITDDYRGARTETKVWNPADKSKKDTKRIHSDSLWKIYLQILGLSGIDLSKLQADRSIKPILKNNQLLHPLAEDSFPDRDGLNKILNGEHVSYERVRKILVLLVFYRFWVRLALRRGSYQADYKDADRCICSLDDYLTNVGYPVLYAGNPFDWIIMHAVADEFPLLVFRGYMQELYHGKL